MPELYLDCDGVLADFNRKFREITGQEPHIYETEHGAKQFWRVIRKHENFYGTLELMEDAMELWEAVKHLNPTILTGIPLGDWAVPQKQGWKTLKFGDNVKMITCLAREKNKYCTKGAILVDDTLKYRHLWEAAGGIFIHHVSAKQSIAELKEIGIGIDELHQHGLGERKGLIV